MEVGKWKGILNSVIGKWKGVLNTKIGKWRGILLWPNNHFNGVSMTGGSKLKLKPSLTQKINKHVRDLAESEFYLT